MTEARTIRADEADAFLHLLCSVFGLNFERVRPVYYNEPYFDLQRKWALFEDGEMVTILSTTPLQFGWGRASGIAGVATVEDARSRGYASDLLQEVIRAQRERGDEALFLFAEDARVYERLGFRVLDEVVKGPLDSDIVPHSRTLDSEELRERYDAWADGHANRLRRDERRWRYWSWNLRVSVPIGDGYLCQEGKSVREALGIGGALRWRTSEPCVWSGLRSMAKSVGAPLRTAKRTTQLMGLGASEPPQMFLTDQW